MKNKSFSELYNIKDMLNDQIRNETDKIKLIELIDKLQIVRKAIRKKTKQVIKQLEKCRKNAEEDGTNWG